MTKKKDLFNILLHISRIVLFYLYLLQIAVPDLLETVKDADIFIFVVPHQFVRKICEEMKGHIKKDAIAVSMIKVYPYLFTTFASAKIA